MRFENWDVLLFPQVSGTPIQEFRTECFGVVTPIGLCPTLNTYIPSLPRGTPFKISLHSWSKPVLSSPKLVRGHQVDIAMHVAIDGKTVAIQKINADGNFPHQIFNSPVTRTIFPPFHKSIRSQLQLHVADNLGRITVGLSEGYFYQADDGRPHFSPIKDIVMFKWIHAPQKLLRKAGIAWPNAAPLINHVPHVSYPTDADNSGFLPSWCTSGFDGSSNVDQVLAGTSRIDLNDLTLSSEFSSDYTFGGPLSQVRDIANAIVPDQISMRTSCNQLPPCVMDASDGHVLHGPA